MVGAGEGSSPRSARYRSVQVATRREYATCTIPATPVSDAFFAELCTVVEAEVGRCGVPGLALGLLHEDQPHSASFGVTSIDNPLPVTPDTLFQVGSITKTFTATAAMRLVAAGQLDRDAPVRTYLSDLQLRDADATARLTPRHLLTHTGGWMGDHFADTGRGDDALARYVCELDAAVCRRARGYRRRQSARAAAVAATAVRDARRRDYFDRG